MGTNGWWRGKRVLRRRAQVLQEKHIMRGMFSGQGIQRQILGDSIFILFHSPFH